MDATVWETKVATTRAKKKKQTRANQGSSVGIPKFREKRQQDKRGKTDGL